MLSKDKRLNLSTDFKWVSLGRVFQSANFKIFYRPGENKTAKIGVAINSKNLPKAVGRNRAKRIMFNAFGKIYGNLPDNSNIIALPKQGIDNVKSDDLVLELTQALGKIL